MLLINEDTSRETDRRVKLINEAAWEVMWQFPSRSCFLYALIVFSDLHTSTLTSHFRDNNFFLSFLILLLIIQRRAPTVHHVQITSFTLILFLTYTASPDNLSYVYIMKVLWHSLSIKEGRIMHHLTSTVTNFNRISSSDRFFFPAQGILLEFYLLLYGLII